MPIYLLQSRKGPFFRYGSVGKKYYFDASSERSMKRAYNHALKQSQAIHASQRRKM